MCSTNKTPSYFQCSDIRTFTKTDVSHLDTFLKIFGRKPKACRNENDCIEEFRSPFEPKQVKVPSWLLYDGVILRFFAYYQESIPESSLENYRVHHCEIRFYMENGCIEVSEPHTYDPGYAQGRIISKSKIPLPHDSDNFYTIEHLTIGCEVDFYGKCFHICGCDEFTRKFLNKRGFPLLPNFDPPTDIASEKRKEELIALQFTKRPGVSSCRLMEKGKKFIENTRKVLRFWAYWDDRCNFMGTLRRFIVLYYLEDDTMEITEISNGENYSMNPLFLRRGKLLKNAKSLCHLPGDKMEGYEVLNTTMLTDQCGNFSSNSFLTDRLYTGLDDNEVYGTKDLAIGATISVYGRCFILTDCDEFTRNYYREKYGATNFTPLVIDEPKYEIPTNEIPPDTGYGQEEDTLANWDKILPKAPSSKSFSKMITDVDVYVFKARLYNCQHKANADRRFILKYFLSDSGIQILEEEHPNTGFIHRMFLSRTRVKKPDNYYVLGTRSSDYYEPKDMFIGNILDINKFSFQIYDAPDCTLSLMEKNQDIFPQSNICLVLDKVREAFGPLQSIDVLQCFSSGDTNKVGVKSTADFRDTLHSFTKGGLSEHEMALIIRTYRIVPPNPPPDLETLRVVLHTEMKKYQFDHHLLRPIEYTFRHLDPCRLGTVSRGSVEQVLRGAKAPFSKELTQFLAFHFPPADSCDRINYCELLRYLDWEETELPDATPTSLRCILQHLEPQPPPNITCVNYRAFLESVCPNFKCDLHTLLCSQCPESGCENEGEMKRDDSGNCTQEELDKFFEG